MQKFTILSLFVGLLCSCSEADLPGEGMKDPNQISIVAQYPCATRATATAFEQGDPIGLFAVAYNGTEALPLQVGNNFLNNEQFTYQNSVWTPKRTLYWGDTNLDFYAYYPYTSIHSVDKLIYEIAADQRVKGANGALDAYEKSDFLYAKTTNAARADGDVQLRFNHLFSKMLIKLEKGPTFEGEFPKDVNVSIYNTVTTATVNLQAGSATKYAYGTKNTVQARQSSPTTFEAILVPQYIDTLTPLVEITMDGIAYLLDYSISLRPGYIHEIKVVLNTSPDQEKIEISIDGSIEDWNKPG